MTTYDVTIQQISTGKLVDVYKVVGANKAEAQREADERIRRSSMPHDLRIGTIQEAKGTISAVGAVSADAQVVRAPRRELYETDLALWAKGQAELLRLRAEGTLINEAEFDWSNIAEEIEDVAVRQRDQIESRLSILCEHLLKWQFQPAGRSGSWRGSVVEARDRIARVVQKNPSLRDYPAAVLGDTYPPGKRKAEAETGLTNLPETCPWTIEQLLDHAFWP